MSFLPRIAARPPPKVWMVVATSPAPQSGFIVPVLRGESDPVVRCLRSGGFKDFPEWGVGVVREKVGGRVCVEDFGNISVSIGNV